MVRIVTMSRRQPGGGLDEAEQIHAILRPRFVEAGADERRRAALAKGKLVETLAWRELDLAIEALLARMRVDPRPPQPKPPRTRESQRPQVAEAVPPPVPVGKREPTAPDQPVSKVEADRAGTKAPPPLPPIPALPPLPVEPPRLPGLGKAPADELEAPPIPVAPAEARGARKPSATLPVLGADEVDGPLILSRPGNAPETFLLYDDIVNLSAMADRDGLLISLERLLVMARLEDHVRQFVESNEVKLMSLYESELKAFSRSPKRRAANVENTMPRAFLRSEKVAAILPLIDGKATITEIIRKSTFTPVETCSVISQLKRSGILDV